MQPGRQQRTFANILWHLGITRPRYGGHIARLGVQGRRKFLGMACAERRWLLLAALIVWFLLASFGSSIATAVNGKTIPPEA